ncbi:MAG: hypothetical protein IPM23_13925 [Candidatus Melainabacteria bacterium]|nr:hypothetical protein [Candidatus Melainabacteria bacterium]
MFDYHAGEKYKLTLIICGIAGFIIGVFMTALILGESQPQQRQTRQRPKWADHPDVTGVPRDASAQPQDYRPTAEAPAGSEPMAQQSAAPVNQDQALNLVETFLIPAWDLSAGTAPQSQATAIQYMTPDCAAAYQQNVWTPEIAQQIESAGLRSTFQKSSMRIGSVKPDGSVVVLVSGMQIMEVPGKGQRQREVNIEYLVTSTPAGLRIGGIGEGQQGM